MQQNSFIMKVKKLVKTFFKWIEMEIRNNNFSAATLRFYRCRLKRFVEQFGKEKFSKLTPTDIDKYLDRAGRGLSDTTRRHNATSLQSLQAFALKKKLIRKQVFGTLPKPPMGRRSFLPTDEQLEKLYHDAPVHFRLIHSAMSQSAARPAEFCNLQITDIHWNEGDMGAIVIAKHKTARKTGKPRVIPLGTKLRAILLSAIGVRTEGPVFRTENGRKWSPTYLSSTFRTLRERAGLPREYVLYTSRHKAITDMLNAEVPPKFVQEIAGHSTFAMTEKYAHIDAARLGSHMDAI